MLTPKVLQAKLTQFYPYLDEFLHDRLLLTPPRGNVEVVESAEFLTTDYLQASIEALAAECGISELAVAASLWNKLYNNALIPAILPAMTLLGIGLASLENVSLVLKDQKPEAILLHRLDGAVVYPPRFGQGAAPNLSTISQLCELHAFVFTPLLQHLRFLINRVNALTRLPRSVMWGNAGNLCTYLYQELSNCPGGAASQEDRAAIFEQSQSPKGIGRNPLYRTMVCDRVENSEFSELIITRRTCCLLFRMPEGEGYCGNCPMMSREERLARLKH